MMSYYALKAELAHHKPSPKSKAHLWAQFLFITHKTLNFLTERAFYLR